MKYAFSIALTLLFLLQGCSKEESQLLIFKVPEDFLPIVEKFEMEAQIHGIDLRIENLIVQYDSMLNEPICATCNSTSTDLSQQKIININPNQCWANDFQLEALIFHELGHCFLGRSHDDSLLPNGDPKSMMASNNILIYSPCVYAFGDTDDCNLVYRRKYYIDELFDVNTPVPDWAN